MELDYRQKILENQSFFIHEHVDNLISFLNLSTVALTNQ